MKRTSTLLLFLLILSLVFAGCSSAAPEEETAPAPSDPAGDAPEPAPAEGDEPEASTTGDQGEGAATLLYQGHGSLRITTAEGKVIYIDPYAGEGYDVPADLILVTHQHPDHNQLDLVENRSDDCALITQDEALAGGTHQSFDLGFVSIEAVEAYNDNHDPAECVGYILTLSDGVSVYVTGDTSTTAQMESLAARNLDYAFFCCDGVYNMDIDEASDCAALVAAKYSIPYHMSPGELFDRGRAELFQAEGRLIVADGEELALTA